MSDAQARWKFVISNMQRGVKAPARRVRAAAVAAAEVSDLPPGVYSVVLVGDRKMRHLNRAYAGVAGTTDVLAFDLGAGDAPGDEDVAGEVIANASLAGVEADKRGKGTLDELLLYVVHGICHLGGYRDTTTGERARMRAAERRVFRHLAKHKAGQR